MDDGALRDAAEEGNLKFLRKAAAVQPPEYFLTKVVYVGQSVNIFHVAASRNRVEFLKEAVKILPTNIIKQLLEDTTNEYRWTVLHAAVAGVNSNITVLRTVIEMYASCSSDDENHVKPWLALNRFGETPLNFALRVSFPEEEEFALELMSIDPEFESWFLPDDNMNAPLYHAVNAGFNLVAEKILMSPLHETSFVCTPGFGVILGIATRCSENVVRLLLEKCHDLFDNDGNTSLHSILKSTPKTQENEDVALDILSRYPAMCKIRNNKGESPFFLAVRFGYEQVVHEIMRIAEPRFHMLLRNDGTTVVHSLFCCPEKTGRWLLNKYWWLVNLRDNQGKTALDYANEENALWLVKLLTNPSFIEAAKEDFNWIEASKRGETEAVLAFADYKNLQIVCREANDTPLHHIILPTYNDYLKFLKNPLITDIKNTTDHDGATALHRALEREDMHFAKALLLDDGIERIIRNHAGTTAMDLLAKLCKENDDWGEMCKQLKVNVYLRTTYIQPGTNLDQMRNTLSVIAALLATITFAAGFTLPGGINSNNGEALLGKKPAFIVFLLADAYAMCTSMLVLFCLVWSMVSELDMSRLLVDRSVFLLMQSLYATLLTFITGIYAVIEHSSLWATIVIFVMCSTIAIAANQKILHSVFAKLVPTVKEVVSHQQRRACLRLKDSIVTLCVTVLRMK